jgi:hypothetical protein
VGLDEKIAGGKGNKDNLKIDWLAPGKLHGGAIGQYLARPKRPGQPARLNGQQRFYP